MMSTLILTKDHPISSLFEQILIVCTLYKQSLPTYIQVSKAFGMSYLSVLQYLSCFRLYKYNCHNFKKRKLFVKNCICICTFRSMMFYFVPCVCCTTMLILIIFVICLSILCTRLEENSWSFILFLLKFKHFTIAAVM